MTTRLAQTQMACDEALMTFDDQIAQIVGAAAGHHGHQRPDDPGEGRGHAELP